MKIIVSANSSWNLYNFRKKILKVIEDQFNCYFIFLCPEDKYIEKLNLKKSSFRKVSINPRKFNIFQDIYLFFQYFYYFLKERPDLYISFTIKPNLYGATLANLFSIKSINNFTGLGNLFNSGKIKKIIIIIVLKIILYKSKYIFFHNNDNLQLFVKNKIAHNSKFILVPGSGVDLKKFSLNNNPIHKEKINFLFFSRIMKEKGIIEFLTVAKKIKNQHENINFSILGKIDTNEKFIIDLLNQCIKTKIVKYYGFKDNVINIVKKYDCIVLPTYHEGMSKSLLESAALSKPIISTDIPGVREIVVNKQDGFLVKPFDIPDLLNKINDFIKLSYNKKTQMAKKSRNIIEKNFDEKIVINKYISVFKEILLQNKD